MTVEQGNIILQQLGGNRFKAMTGAKLFVVSEQGLGFKVGKNSKSVNYVRIQLNGNDLYDVKFCRIRNFKETVVSFSEDIFCDQLEEVFTRHTGLRTRLF